jgi:hypothetical protein
MPAPALWGIVAMCASVLPLAACLQGGSGHYLSR